MELQTVGRRLKVVGTTETATVRFSYGLRSTVYSLIGPPLGNYKDGMPVAAVRKNKNYVSYHLMPVYAFPDMLDDISPQLRTLKAEG